MCVSFSVVNTLASLLSVSEDLFGYIPGISTTNMRPRNSPGTCMQMCKIKETTNLRNADLAIGFRKGDINSF